MTRHPLRYGEIIQARAEDVYGDLEPGYTLIEQDGPYGIDVGPEWDKVKDLAAFYHPHLVEQTRLAAPSASLYFWNTHGGLIDVDPVIRELGWTRRAVITWHKTNAQAQRATDGVRTFPDFTEICAFYQRDAFEAPSVAYAAGRDDRNWIRLWLVAEWEAAGLRNRQADEALGTRGMAGHYFGASQWGLPTLEAYLKLAAYAAERGKPRERPYLVHESVWGAVSADMREQLVRATHEALAQSHAQLMASHQHLRDEYEAARAPFTLIPGLGNVWAHPVIDGAERLLGEDGQTLHPCQKPTIFYRRKVEASSRPKDRILSVFGGTCRMAVACESIARYHPEEARSYTVIEQDLDGRGYIPAVLRQIQGDLDGASGKRGQVSLFGAPK